jgi:hypothetical protein
MLKDLNKHAAIALRWIMRARPTRRLQQLILTWLQRPQIREMPTRPLVDNRVELEMDLIQQRREQHRQRITIAAPHRPLKETLGQPEVQVR